MIQFDNRRKSRLRVPKGTTVIHAAKQLRDRNPYFLLSGSDASIRRLPHVLGRSGKNAKLQTSCTLEATEGMVVKTQSEIAEKGRKEILEFLLINHPLDCPICDRGGECPLQDRP